MKSGLFSVAALSVSFAPVSVLAATPTNLGQVTGLFVGIIDTYILPLIAGLTVLSLLWGTAKFIGRSGNEKDHAAGRSLLIAGVIGLFLFVALYGILAFFYNDSGFSRPYQFPVGLPQ